MSTLHKVKAYFGMAPMEDYDDEYYDDDDRGTARGYPRRRARRFDDEGYGRSYEGRDYDERAGRLPRRLPRRGAFRSEAASPRDFDRPAPRFSALRGSTRGALAMDPRRMAMLFDEGSPLSKITTLRPKDYSEARTIGERFRDGTPVIMDLVTMDNADAKRLVDFAAGPGVRAARLVRQGRDQGVPAVAGRCRRQRRRPQAHRRGWLLRLSVGRTGRNPAGRLAGRLAASRGHCGSGRHRPCPVSNVTHLPTVRSAQLALFFEILGFALFVFWLLLIARVVVEFIRSFQPRLAPEGPDGGDPRGDHDRHRPAGEAAAPPHSAAHR